MKSLLGIVLWIGVFLTVSEWLYARRSRVTIPLIEKLILALSLPMGLAAQLAVELAGFAPEPGLIVALVIGAILNGWAMKRRIQRRTA